MNKKQFKKCINDILKYSINDTIKFKLIKISGNLNVSFKSEIVNSLTKFKNEDYFDLRVKVVESSKKFYKLNYFLDANNKSWMRLRRSGSYKISKNRYEFYYNLFGDEFKLIIKI